MKARSPLDGEMYYFVDKCLPFRASISCAHFQNFSDAVAHLVRWRVGLNKEVVNYLDDFLFIAFIEWLQVQLPDASFHRYMLRNQLSNCDGKDILGIYTTSFPWATYRHSEANDIPAHRKNSKGD